MACPPSAYWPAAVACRPASAGAGLAPAGLPCTWAAPCPCLGLRGLLAPLVGSSCCRESWAGSGSSQPGPLPRLARWSEGRSAAGGGSRTPPPPPAAVADGRRRRRLSAPPRALAAAASHAQPSVPRAAARAASPRVLLRPRKSTAHKQKNKGKSKNKTENSSPNYSLNTQRIRSRFQP